VYGTAGVVSCAAAAIVINKHKDRATVDMRLRFMFGLLDVAKTG
jgi:hypothetical protein